LFVSCGGGGGLWVFVPLFVHSPLHHLVSTSCVLGFSHRVFVFVCLCLSFYFLFNVCLCFALSGGGDVVEVVTVELPATVWCCVEVAVTVGVEVKWR
jgi:hypothetical protein